MASILILSVDDCHSVLVSISKNFRGLANAQSFGRLICMVGFMYSS